MKIIGVVLTDNKVSRIIKRDNDRRIHITYCSDKLNSLSFDNIDRFFDHLDHIPNAKFVESVVY